MWPIGKRSTLYSAEILALQKDKFHANISERRFETKFFNHYSQTKNNTESATWVKKPQSNFFFPKKGKGKIFLGIICIINLPVGWFAGCFPLPYLLYTLKLFS